MNSLILTTLIILFVLILSSIVSVVNLLKNTRCGIDNDNILDKLRNEIIIERKRFGNNLRAYIILTKDAHQNEFISDRDNYIKYLSSFTGTNGFVVVTMEKAALFVDSRYTIQAKREVNEAKWNVYESGYPPVSTWIIKNLPNNSKIGIDPFLVGINTFKVLSDKLMPYGSEMVSIHRNLVETIYIDRPESTSNRLIPLELKYSGRNISSKINEIREKLTNISTVGIFIFVLDDIAWILNLRSDDIPYTPVFYSFLIITMDKIELYIKKERITLEIEQHFHKEGVKVTIRNYNDITNGIIDLAKSTKNKIATTDQISQGFYDLIPNEKWMIISRIVAVMKSIKNDIQVRGMYAAYLRESLIIIRFMYWLENEINNDKTVTELDASKTMLKFKRADKNFKSLSFETISSFGANTAIAHYRPTLKTNVKITKNNVYLFDTGSQYLDGTTDISRTLYLGEPEIEEIKKNYTLVLKGLISVITDIFPNNITVDHFDKLSKQALNAYNQTFDLGAGHGVGSYLSVHEYPPLLSSYPSTASRIDNVVYENIFTSIEPGYYVEGKYGIRLEDVIHTKRFNSTHLKFEVISLIPFEKKLIDLCMLTPKEIKYINQYHRSIREKIGRNLKNEPGLKDWLEHKTSCIKRKYEQKNHCNMY